MRLRKRNSFPPVRLQWPFNLLGGSIYLSTYLHLSIYLYILYLYSNHTVHIRTFSRLQPYTPTYISIRTHIHVRVWWFFGNSLVGRRREEVVQPPLVSFPFCRSISSRQYACKQRNLHVYIYICVDIYMACMYCAHICRRNTHEDREISLSTQTARVWVVWHKR